MDWDDARLFLAIAREGQMLSAARRLDVSQAQLSRRLQRLEEALGRRLFDRSTRGCRLTDAGETFRAAAERVEAEMLQATAALGATEEAVSGTVRIGAPDGLGGAYLSQRLGRLSEAHPRLRIQLAPLPRTFSLSEREADLAIMVGRPLKGRLVTRRLADYTLGIYCSRSYLRQAESPASLADLQGHRLVGYVDDLLPTPELNYASELWGGWRASIEISTAIGQHEAVRAGAGIGVLHDFMARNDPELVRLLPEVRAERSYWVAWHENMRVSRRVTAVADWLAQTMHADRALFRAPDEPAAA